MATTERHSVAKASASVQKRLLPPSVAVRHRRHRDADPPLTRMIGGWLRRRGSVTARMLPGDVILHSGKRIGAVKPCNCSGLAQGGKPAARIPSANFWRSMSL